MIPILLIGAGGHCKSVIEVIESTGLYTIEGIIDKPELLGKEILGYRVIGDDNDLPRLVKQCPNFHITVGQMNSNTKRVGLFDSIVALGGHFPVIISESAIVSKHSNIGPGTILMHQVVVNSGAQVGKNTILNTGCIVEHDTKIGNHCHVSTGAILNGDVEVQDYCFIGSHATIIQGICIASKNTIGAGATVIANTKESGLYVGTPAILKKRQN